MGWNIIELRRQLWFPGVGCMKGIASTLSRKAMMCIVMVIWNELVVEY